jgi:ribosome-binding factor A
MVMTELMQILRSPYLIKIPVDKMNVELVSLISIVEVEMSVDTKVAKIMTSAVGSDTEKRQAVKWLNENNKALRFALAQRMKHLKSVPELRFTEARLPQAMAVMSILDQIAREREEKEAKLRGDQALAGELDVVEGMEREMARISESQDLHSRISSPLSVSS